MYSPKSKVHCFEYAEDGDTERVYSLPRDLGSAGGNDGFDELVQADLKNFQAIENALSGLADMWTGVSTKVRDMISLNVVDVKISPVS